MMHSSSLVLILPMIAGIVLCGGKSTRMGYPKAMLPFGSELLLPRVVRLLGEVADPIVVVAAAEQDVPELPPEVLTVRDGRQAQGPLEGLRGGLAVLAGRAAYAYATSCDVPLLVPAFVRRLIELAEGGRWQAVVPEAEGFKHPLSALYATSILPHVERLLAADCLRPVSLLDKIATRIVDSALLRQVDPTLATLRNLNHPQDYLAALQQAGLSAPEDLLARLR
jgi:molybdopterin-guanine dinucleotide biosynthesis protein A